MAADSNTPNASGLFAYAPQTPGQHFSYRAVLSSVKPVPGCWGLELPQAHCPRQVRKRRTGTFITPPLGCDYSVGLDGCPLRSDLDWVALRQKRYYFFGQSVTRHYAYSMADVLVIGRDSDPLGASRLEEKARASAGAQPARHKGTRFYWKNYIGMQHAYDDEKRDACAPFKRPQHLDSPTGQCFARLLRGATENDVLVIGSISVNTTEFKRIGGNSYIGGPEMTLAAVGFDAAHMALLRLLLRQFPGAIVWHSYPYVRLEADTKPSCGRPKKSGNLTQANQCADKNACIGPINAAIRCAILRLGSSRVQFLNLWELQRQRQHEYVDQIHHPGPLSEAFVFALLGMLQPRVSVAASNTWTASKRSKTPAKH